MIFFRWIALLQPIILSLALIFFRPQWVGLAHENKDALSISSSSPDIDDIREKLKYLEESALSSKNLDGIEDSISDLYKLTGEMQEVVRKYSKHEGPVNCCNGTDRKFSHALNSHLLLSFSIRLTVFFFYL